MDWRSKIGILLVPIVLIAVGLLLKNWYPPAQEPLVNGMQGETRIQLYFYNPARDTDADGNLLCSSTGLVPVARVIPKTQTPLAESIRLVLRGEITDAERAQGITSEFPLPGVELERAVIENGVATLTFKDPENKTGGGSCRVAILWAQIEATAKQFPTVTSVRFEPAELFQP